MALEDKFIIRRIQNFVDNGINSDDGEVTEVRQNMFSRYMGELYGNEREGYSKYVSREVLQAVEWALPSLLRVFTGGIRPVEFKASGEKDEQQAKHETDVVNHWFADGNVEASGFITLYSWLKDLLLYPNGYVKVSVEEEEETDTDEFEGITDDIFDTIEEKGGEIEVTRRYWGKDRNNQKIRLYDVAVTSTKWSKRIVVEPIAPDCCIIAHNHNKLDVDKAEFICIREQKSRSDLRKMGFDADMLEDLSQDDSETWNDERVNLLFYTDEQPSIDGDSAYDLEADEMFWVHECYMYVDYDEDGVNELRKVTMAGCRILENEACDFQPIVAASAIHITHKHVGMSYAEIVADLQELMTTLTRQLLDNIYKQNVQRRFINENALLSDNRTMDQLLDGTSETILVRGDPNAAVFPEQITPIVQEIGVVIEQFKEQPQMRTGVAPQLSLDPGVLEKATMGAFVGALEQASQRLELLARLFAETGLKKVFQKIHYCLRTYFDQPQEVQINKKWITVNPKDWKRRSNMNVNVGLGFNNKQAMLGLLTQLLAIQKEALQLGLSDAKTIYATLEKLVEQANLGSAATYFNDPNEPDFKAPPPPPNPQLILAQAQANALNAEAKRKDAAQGQEQAKHAAELANAKETAELNATKATNDFIKIKEENRLNTAKIAEIHAKITSLNRGDKMQSGPAEDSSEDEFAAANGEAKPKAKKPKAKPATVTITEGAPA